MPTRTFIRKYRLSRVTQYKNANSPSSDYTRSETTESSAYADQRVTESQVKDWRRRLRESKDATTTLFGTRFTYRKGIGERLSITNDNKLIVRTSGEILSDLTFPSTGVNVTLVDQATSRAQIAFSKKVRTRTQSWAGGVFVGELLETAKMLANPVKRLRYEVSVVAKKVAEIAKKRKLLDGRGYPTPQYWDAVADTWLTWSFGVKPMINDANDAANAFERLSRGDKKDVVRITATGEAEAYSRTTHLGYPITSTPYLLVDVRLKHVDTCMVIYRGAIKSSAPSGDMPVPMQFGLDLSSFVPTVHELIPYSYLVDYFTNVGDVLDAWSMRFIEFAWLNRTVRNRRVITPEHLSPTQTSGFYSTLYMSQMPRGTTYKVERARADNLFMPNLSTRIPGFPSTKWLNLAALYRMKDAIRPPRG